jgi:hypothetical protein
MALFTMYQGYLLGWKGIYPDWSEFIFGDINILLLLCDE